LLLAALPAGRPTRVPALPLSALRLLPPAELSACFPLRRRRLAARAPVASKHCVLAV